MNFNTIGRMLRMCPFGTRLPLMPRRMPAAPCVALPFANITRTMRTGPSAGARTPVTIANAKAGSSIKKIALVGVAILCVGVVAYKWNQIESVRFPKFQKGSWQKALMERAKVSDPYQWDNWSQLARALQKDLPINRENVEQLRKKFPPESWIDFFRSITVPAESQQAFWTLFPLMFHRFNDLSDGREFYEALQNHPCQSNILKQCAQELATSLGRLNLEQCLSLLQIQRSRYMFHNLAEILPWSNKENLKARDEVVSSYLSHTRLFPEPNHRLHHFFAFYSVPGYENHACPIMARDKALFLNLMLEKMTQAELHSLIEFMKQSEQMRYRVLRAAIVPEQSMKGFQLLIDEMKKGGQGDVEKDLQYLLEAWKSPPPIGECEGDRIF